MKVNKKMIIFYFSGTGNSLYVAKEIAKTFEHVDIVAIPQAIDEKRFVYENYSQVGFVMPLYFMGMPVMVKEFIDKISIPNAAYIFSIVTRAYTKGLVFTEINKMLIKKGKNLNYGKYISFPDCYIRWDQAHDEKSQLKVFKKAEEQLEIIKQEILGEDIFIQKEGEILTSTSFVVNKIWSIRLPSINKSFKVSSDCIQCGICIKICPAKNIELEDNVIKWNEKCQDCMACVQSCPSKAIYFNSRTKSKKRYRNPNISLTELFYW